MSGFKIHPRRWLKGLIAYSSYLGYIKPKLIGSSEEEYKIKRKLLANAWEPRKLSLSVGKKILVLSPHPDDESVGAGGLLWAHKDNSEIHFIVFSKGEKGGILADNPDNQDVRKTEFSKVACALNAKSCHFLNFPDSQIPDSEDAKDKLRSIMDRIKPDTVLLPWFLDDHIDHRMTNLLYAKASKDIEAMVLAYEVWTLLDPNAIFDISDYLDGKLSLIKNYKSQLGTIDYINYVSGLSKVRAYQYPVNPKRNGAVEAYLALPNHEYCDLVLGGKATS